MIRETKKKNQHDDTPLPFRARVCVFRKALRQKNHTRLAHVTVAWVNENGDEKGGRLEILSLVIRSRRRSRQPIGVLRMMQLRTEQILTAVP
jgi:hypothetical protein